MDLLFLSSTKCTDCVLYYFSPFERSRTYSWLYYVFTFYAISFSGILVLIVKYSFMILCQLLFYVNIYYSVSTVISAAGAFISFYSILFYSIIIQHTVSLCTVHANRHPKIYIICFFYLKLYFVFPKGVLLYA